MAIDAIIDWASKQPDWQQDALRRIAISLDLTDADSSEILANLKISKGLPQKGEPLLQPVTKDHVQSDVPTKHLWPASDRSITSRMRNRLAPDQVLPFALDGITLIDGHNSSGKSGYCRILKKFCRAILKDTIHPDVFATGTPAPAEARIRYNLEGSKDVSGVTWRDGVEGPSDIAHLSVFDSHCGIGTLLNGQAAKRHRTQGQAVSGDGLPQAHCVVAKLA